MWKGLPGVGWLVSDYFNSWLWEIFTISCRSSGEIFVISNRTKRNRERKKKQDTIPSKNISPCPTCYHYLYYYYFPFRHYLYRYSFYICYLLALTVEDPAGAIVSCVVIVMEGKVTLIKGGRSSLHQPLSSLSLLRIPSSAPSSPFRLRILSSFLSH